MSNWAFRELWYFLSPLPILFGLNWSCISNRGGQRISSRWRGFFWNKTFSGIRNESFPMKEQNSKNRYKTHILKVLLSISKLFIPILKLCFIFCFARFFVPFQKFCSFFGKVLFQKIWHPLYGSCIRAWYVNIMQYNDLCPVLHISIVNAVGAII